MSRHLQSSRPVRTVVLAMAALAVACLATLAFTLASTPTAASLAPELTCNFSPEAELGHFPLRPRPTPTVEPGCLAALFAPVPPVPSTPTPAPSPTPTPTPEASPSPAPPVPTVEPEPITEPSSPPVPADARGTRNTDQGSGDESESEEADTAADTDTVQQSPQEDTAEQDRDEQDRTSTGAEDTTDTDAGDKEADAEETDDPVQDEALGIATDDYAVADLAAWVETQAGRSFTSPSTVEFFELADPSQESIETAITVESWSLWSTLGLIDPGHSRRSASTAWVETGRGRCCPAQVALGDDRFRTALITVHELTHALDWERAQPVASIHAISPVLTIAEGNAQRMAREWGRQIGAAPEAIDAASSVFDNAQDPRLPQRVRRILNYPYDEGLAFANAIFEAEGEAAIVEAFNRPPNGAEVLNPQRWLDRELWPSIGPPVDLLDAQPWGAGQLGPFILALMIEPAVGQAQALDLVSSWRGDGYAITATVEQSCVAIRVLVGDDDSAVALGDALRQSDGFVISSGAFVNFTRCS